MNRLFNSLFDCSIVRLFVIRLLAVYLSTAYCLLPTFSCSAQQRSEVIKYARTIVDTLASPSMHGRGYVNKGDSIAADFIKKEFEKYRLTGNYVQNFNIRINIFPGNINLNIDGKEFFVGKDFIPNAYSSSCNGLYKVIIFHKKNFWKRKITRSWRKADLLSYAAVIDTSQLSKKKIDFIYSKMGNFGIRILLVDNKLSAELTSSQIGFTSIRMLKSSLVRKKVKTLNANIESSAIPYATQNIIGYIEGSQYPDSFIVFTAHYDHLGQMGKDVYFPGANDNASGVAMLLSLAKYYSQLSLLPSGGAGGGLKYSIAFMAFGAEEVGLLGSMYYVKNPLFPLKKIKFLVNFDIVGTGDEGIKVVNATEHKKEFDELVKINSKKNLLPSVQPRGKAAISDHHFFEEAEVKTFYIYTLGGIKAYHDIYDRPETLPLTGFEDLYKLVIEFAEYLQR